MEVGAEEGEGEVGEVVAEVVVEEEAERRWRVPLHS